MTHTNAGGSEAAVDATTSDHPRKPAFPLLVLGALGVVYGDIGTSPIYAFRQTLEFAPDGAAAERGILGLLSLIIWSLTITVTLKYIFFVTRADNKGEGGTLSLMTLARTGFSKPPRWILVAGVVGAALFFGDAVITPAISVLSSVEGIAVVAPQLQNWVVPITVVIIIGVFSVQRFGTASVSRVFGPVTAVWFLVLGVSGLLQTITNPQVLWALSPVFGVQFLAENAPLALLVMGAVFLSVTGVEGLYVDLGHFGRRPIVVAWFSLVFPCLLLNYFGQGAYVLSVGAANVSHPFFEMHPDWALLPMVALATLATIIASQAVISGAYSLAQQAIALNILPRMTVLHTSETQSGQIYMPQVNTILMVFVLLLVVSFGSSSALSHAYGLAVSGVMLVTTMLLPVVMRRLWKWRLLPIGLVMVPFFAIDAAFFIANAAKLLQGGWVPALIAAVLAFLVMVWIAGRKRLTAKTRRDEVPLRFLVDNLARSKPQTVPGTAVFLTAELEGAPVALLHSLKHYKVLHEHNVILTVMTSSAPRVPDAEKVTIETLNDMFSRVTITFGFMETPNIPTALALARKLGWKFDIMSTSFFLSRRSLKTSPKRGLAIWMDRIFAAMAKNAIDATEYFHIPTGRVVEIGTQVIL